MTGFDWGRVRRDDSRWGRAARGYEITHAGDPITRLVGAVNGANSQVGSHLSPASLDLRSSSSASHSARRPRSFIGGLPPSVQERLQKRSYT